MPDLASDGGSRSRLPMPRLSAGLIGEERVEPPPQWPALDGLRAVAVVGVILYHIGVLPGGFLGVDVFFVLSGFLITALLLREWDARGGRVSFRYFYARRALRLLPALGCVIAGALVVAGALALTTAAGRSYVWTTLAAVPWVLGFAGNWVRAMEPAAPIGSLGALGQTWSLAVEEQFYLLWPALFVLLMRRRISRRRLALVLTLLAVTEMIYRSWLSHLGYGGDRIYYATDTHSDGLLIGCAAAFWEADRSRETVGTTARSTTVMWLAVALLAALFVTGSRSGPPIETSAAVLASAVITLGVVTGRAPAPLLRLLSSRHAVLIGRRSYGLYLWQYVVLAATEALSTRFVTISLAGPWYGRMAFAAVMVAGLGATFALAEVSYRCVELPALRLKRKFKTAVIVTDEPLGMGTS
jgi:peptidoglycan/LPS O-acetylase OafA/YrhL